MALVNPAMTTKTMTMMMTMTMTRSRSFSHSTRRCSTPFPLSTPHLPWPQSRDASHHTPYRYRAPPLLLSLAHSPPPFLHFVSPFPSESSLPPPSLRPPRHKLSSAFRKLTHRSCLLRSLSSMPRPLQCSHRHRNRLSTTPSASRSTGLLGSTICPPRSGRCLILAQSTPESALMITGLLAPRSSTLAPPSLTPADSGLVNPRENFGTTLLQSRTNVSVLYTAQCITTATMG
jgi:hypothetical protein